MSAVSTVEDLIREIVRSGKVVIGFRRSVKNAKIGKVKALIVAQKIPGEMLSEILYIAKIGDLPVIMFRGGSIDLGTLVGKPFPVSTIGVLDTGNVSIDKIREFASSQKG
jgi:large subunit ribosomal protein L30e